MQNAGIQPSNALAYQEYVNYHTFHHQKNSQIIHDAQATAKSIFSEKSHFYGKASDFLDHGLKRVEHRVYGILLDILVYSITKRFVHISTYRDYKIDCQKIELLNNRISNINMLQIQGGTPLDLAATLALKTDKKIVENFLDYTVKSKNIKLVSFICSSAALVLGHSDIASQITYLGAGCLFVHWLAGGSKLEGKNQTLAEGILFPI